MSEKTAAELIRGAKRAERTVPVCLRLDLVAEHERLERQLAEEQRSHGDSLGGGRTGELAQRMAELRDEMLESTLDVRLRAMRRPAYQTLKRAHPPRADNDRDKLMGVNEETFFEPLLRICMVEPQLDDAVFREFVDELSDAQFEQLTTAAWALNQRTVDIPFSRAASALIRSSEPE